MGTGDNRANLYLKKFLPQQQFQENIQFYLQDLTEEFVSIIYPQSGVFQSTAGVITPGAADRFNISTPLLGTDALGHLMTLDPLQASEIPFENTNAVEYFVGLRFNFLDASNVNTTEVNVRTGLLEYTFDQESIGEIGDPELVVDNGSTITLRVNGVTEPGVSNAGRTVRVYMKPRQKGGATGALSETVPFEDITVAFSGGNNEITTSTLLGQTAGSVSTDFSDYTVMLLGPTVKRNTDLSLDPNIIFLGKITGTGPAAVITLGDIDQLGKVVLSVLNPLIPSGQTHAVLLEGGGTVGHSESTVGDITWGSDIKVRPLGTSDELTITAASASLADDEVGYVDLPKPFVSGTVALQIADRNSPALTSPDVFWIFHRNGIFVNVRGGMQLEQGEQRQLEDIVIGNAIFFSEDDQLRYLDADNSYHFEADGGTDNADVFAGRFIATINEFIAGLLVDGDLIRFADGGTPTWQFLTNSVLRGSITEDGDYLAVADLLTQSGVAYTKASDATRVTAANASLNEVYDQTLSRELLRTTPNNPGDTAINIASARKTLADGEEFGLVNNKLLSAFLGGTVDFATGVNSNGDNFTPFTPGAASRFFKYGIVLSKTNTIVIIPPTSDFATLVAAKADTTQPVLSGGTPVSVIVVQDDGAGGSGTILSIVEENIIRFGAAGGGAGSAGGGLSGEWQGDALEDFEFNEKVLLYAQGDTQIETIYIKVPQEYTATNQILSFLGFYSPSAVNNFEMQTTTTLIRRDTDAIDDVTNQHVSATGDITNTLANQFREGTLELTDSVGEINSVQVNPGDLLKVELIRIAPTPTEDAADIRFIPSSTEVTFG